MGLLNDPITQEGYTRQPLGCATPKKEQTTGGKEDYKSYQLTISSILNKNMHTGHQSSNMQQR